MIAILARSLDSSIINPTNHAPIAKKSALKKETVRLNFCHTNSSRQLLKKINTLRLTQCTIFLQVLHFSLFLITRKKAEKDEIPLQVGDVVYIFNMHESGWWTGDCNGKYGIFPGGF